ncbi:probable disease resistance protein At1g62630 [Lactuca sativa]|nr:probable disease resistance protein At1g62630 [Lactuca sativa]
MYLQSLMVLVKKQLGYLFSTTKHVRNMNTKMKQPDCTSRDVKNHMETNNISNLEMLTRACVTGWLKDVEKIKEDAQIVSSIRNGCFNLKMRYRGGRNAFKIIEEMGSLIEENSKIIWSDVQKPLGKVNSQNASTLALWDGDAQNYLKLREKSFKDAPKFLQQDHTSQVIALYGMRGVGKTTMTEHLKKAAEDKKMFDWIVKAVIGQKINMLSIQQAVAEYIGQSLIEMSITARADRLPIRYGKMFEGQKKVLVILDGFLPLAVKLIEISYTTYLKEEEKRIFLLCGLFPDDFHIPIEELTRDISPYISKQRSCILTHPM